MATSLAQQRAGFGLQVIQRKSSPQLRASRCLPRLQRHAVVRASAHQFGMLIAAAEEAAKPGSVDAPIGAIIGGALLVTVILTAGIPALLNPGTQAAEKIFDRDAKSGRKR